MKFGAILATSAAAILIPSAAWADDAQNANHETNPSDSTRGLQEIIVTAQYRKENLQKAAVAVDVVNGASLTSSGVTSPAQLTTVVPALQISQSGAGSQSIFIRGVGTLTANSYTDPGVAFNVDGIYIGRPTSIRNIFFDIDRVEVLKGPQGTLYGRNATGGAINVLPVKPKIGELSGEFGAAVGNYNDAKLNAAINIPISEHTAARIAGTWTKHDGYLSDGTNDANSWALRGQFLFEPTSDLNIRLSGDYSHDGGKGNGSTITAYINPLTGTSVINPVAAGVGLADARSAAVFSGLYSFLSGRFGQGVTDTPFNNNNYWGIKAELNAKLSFANLTMLASHRGSSINSIDFGVGFPDYTIQKDHQTSLEARLASPETGLIRWLVGGYYYNEGISSNYEFNISSTASIQQLNTGTTTLASFGRLTIAPTDKLRFVGGVRYTNEKKHFDGVNNVFLDICTNPTVPIPACPTAPFFANLYPAVPSAAAMISAMNLVQVTPSGVTPPVFIQPSAAAANTIFKQLAIGNDGRLETNRVTFRAAVEYDVGPHSLLYASFENGFHAGGFSFAQIAPSYKPENIDAYTIGSKNRFLDGRLQVNFEGFVWKYTNQQISHFATDLSGAQAFVTENAGSSTNKGFEVSVRALPAPRTVLHADVQYLDATYGQFSYNAPTVPTPVVTGCSTTPAGTNLVTVNCAGHTALRSPKWTINAGVEQTVVMGDIEARLGVDSHFQTSNWVGFEMLPTISEQKAYFMTNLSVDFGPHDKTWVIGAYLNNLENNRPYGQIAYNNQFNTFTGSPLPPRTYGVQANFKF